MKKLLFPIVFLMFFFPAMSQGWFYINGTVTDIASGYPIPNHAVTIMTDSTNGVFYYNVVYTDSAGYYFDDVPVVRDSKGIIYVQTIDCQNYLHQAVIYINPNNNFYTQDFQICDLVILCQAYFNYYPQPQGSPDSFQFNDYSQGNIIGWNWSFGDGATSGEQNPLHAYPGPGTYNACLTITGNNCTDTFCRTIVISDTVYHQLYGQVFAGNFPLQAGSVMLFAMNPNGGYSPFGEAWPVDTNGVYYFTLVPDGIYLVLAVPFDSGNFIPTYFGDVINWQAATQVILGDPENPYNINLVQAGLLTPGPGSVSGQINNAGLRITTVDKINMILMNDSGSAIGFSRVSSSGSFEFRSMDYGTYFLHAELPGVTCDNLNLEITAEKPHLDVILNFSGNSILGLDEKSPANETVSVYPNPVTNQLNISFNLSGSERIDIEIYTIAGQLAYRASEIVNAGQSIFSIRFDDLPDGSYMLRMQAEDGISFMRKIIK